MQELIEKLRAVGSEVDAATEWSLSSEALKAIGYVGPLGRWKLGSAFLETGPNILQSIDSLNAVFEQALPGCGRIASKGRISADEPMYGYQIFATDLSASPLDPIGEGEQDIETYAYLIAILKAVEAKRGAA